MKCRNPFTPDQQVVSTEQGLAATRSISSPRPVGGEMFFLTAPFRERWGDKRRLVLDSSFGRDDAENIFLVVGKAAQPGT
jgi:hypothetical protein